MSSKKDQYVGSCGVERFSGNATRGKRTTAHLTLNDLMLLEVAVRKAVNALHDENLATKEGRDRRAKIAFSVDNDGDTGRIIVMTTQHAK